ncbi:hypothetical protein BGW36DRAFT_424232 [Talaromyces proteolyticus]|uniref:F-box domain-containing protein n=1 Tax=Talaromyces proteolyticus TaxID=1131652 RepID=A0AAD4KVE7_9EURO|nr:uncharacterized protein BGW36DRAFT_424232 [Talaromyces proteolyticus]KAH8701937.1 hypothetical protein BGW36DRAFT_424232 [Talaromyces proteolyticus]
MYPKVSLERLPIGVLCTIFRSVGTKHLRQTLLVCKWWYNLAEPIAFEDLGLHADALITASEEAHQRFQNNVRRLSLELHGFKDELAKNSKIISTDKAITARQWSKTLADNLDKLGALSRHSARLKSFAFMASE